MLHMLKLSVGPKDVAQLRAIQKLRAVADPPLRHQTRMMPKRREEVLDGGSIYWVVSGFLQVRQRILDIIEDQWDDGTPCAGLVLDPKLVMVEARATKAFQGWRYLSPEDAPPDVVEGVAASGMEALPPALRAALREARLI
ncbi:DUF1489 family protein [Sediminicoccus rosea]|uniref:DUF1489 domain-containing protein n=1 Tax=Sediminicoccus rosea TaxID=1225128 RepID=A0ABZ0PFX3_9PROT|nr:DUF1489 domain-containing protein [Sediminicoccus rosea]WPB84530.1 DUF1489 domain-containing protein [Sediminicoccus rosea]